MKAWILEEQAGVEERPLKLVDLPAPHARADEVRIEIAACGVCRTDIHIAEGDLALRKAPIILGHEVVGIVDEVGEQVERFAVGDRAGVYWLHSACGRCKYCLSGRENYCPEVRCTGWDADGGFAEYVTVPAAYALPLNRVGMDALEIAPLMCPGIAGYAAFKLAEVQAGEKLGLYGFGPTAYCVLKVARARDIAVYVSTRSPRNIEAARREGARWAANAAQEEMPCKLDAAIIFPPAGKLVVHGVRVRNRDGKNDSDGGVSADDIFNRKNEVEVLRTAQFCQDDYWLTGVGPEIGLGPEGSRMGFVVVERERLRSNYDKGTLWTGCLQELASEMMYVSPYTGRVISSD